MSLLLPKEEWEGRSTCDFGRSGLEGDFQLCLPGESLSQQQPQGEGAARLRPNDSAVITVRAELTGADSHLADLVRNGAEAGEHSTTATGAEAASPPEDFRARANPARASVSGVTTWSYLGRRKRRGAITAVLQRLELQPVSSGNGGSGGGGGAALSDRLNGVVVGIANATNGDHVLGAAAATVVVGGRTGIEGFGVVECGERGEVDTEDRELLENITWKWEGEIPAAATAFAEAAAAAGGEGSEFKGEEGGYVGAGGAPLASVRVLGGCSESGGRRRGDVVIAEGVVPWPSSACSGRQHVNVKLVSPEGSEVGSCRVCLSLTTTAAMSGDSSVDLEDTDTTASRRAVGQGNQGVVFEQESGRQERLFEEVGETRGRIVGGREERVSLGVGVGAAAVRTAGVQAEEPPLEGTRVTAADGMVPHSYRMSVNLASVKDLENAAYVVRACVFFTLFVFKMVQSVLAQHGQEVD